MAYISSNTQLDHKIFKTMEARVALIIIIQSIVIIIVIIINNNMRSQSGIFSRVLRAFMTPPAFRSETEGGGSGMAAKVSYTSN